MFAESGRLKIGNNVVINSAFEANPMGGTRTVFLYKGDNALIEVGDNTGISNAIIAAYEHVYIGAGAKLFDTDFHSLDLQERLANINIPHKPVRIKDGVFIGADAKILKGVTIGEEVPKMRGRIPQQAGVKERMRRKLRTAKGRATYKQRKAIVEPVFGQIKEARGFRRFSFRGLNSVAAEWNLVCLTHNLLKLYRHA